MKPLFVTTSNVKRAMAAYAACSMRGASEASWVLITGNAGHGKTRTGYWLADQEDAVHIRVKADVTPTWLKRELARELGIAKPPRRGEELFEVCFHELATQPRPIILDEVENALARSIAVLEAVRDLSDLIEMPVVLIGREWVPERLKEHRQIWSRCSAMASFGKLEIIDVRLLREQLLEVEAAEAIDEIVLTQSQGYIREIMNALANIERIGKRLGRRVEMTDLADRIITRDMSGALDTLRRDTQYADTPASGLRVVK